MIKRLAIYIGIAALPITTAFAQKTGNAGPAVHALDLQKATTYHGGPLLPLPFTEEQVAAWLKKRTGFPDIDGLDLALISKTESQAAIHFRFQVTFRNVPLYRSVISTGVNRSGKPLTTFSTYTSFPSSPAPFFPAPSEAINYLAIQHPGKEWDEVSATPAYLCNDRGCGAVIWATALSTEFDYFEFLIDDTGNMIYRHDLNRYYAQDSSATAKVFLPDPLTTAGAMYGSGYTDNNDADHPFLNNERKNTTMKVMLDGDTFRLKGSYAEIRDFSSPKVKPVRSVNPVFDYPRSDDGFEDVNAFHHIQQFQEHVQALGFTNLGNYAIWIDTHALNGSDNSQFTPGSPNRLFFGEGGVDDAEDADVIIHEYGHALSEDAAPNTNFGVERQCLDEANGDYFAASWSRGFSENAWADVFTWDGHNEFWAGRSAKSAKHYPEDLKMNLYADADIWTATLMEIWEAEGRNVTDRILLQSLYGYAGGMTMRDAAQLFVQADSLLYNGSHYPSLYTFFTRRGLLPDSCLFLQGGLPVADAGDDISVCPRFPAEIGGKPVISGSYSMDSLRWFPATGLDCDTCPNPAILVAQTTTYILKVYVGACAVTDTVVVTARECKGLVSLLNTGPFMQGTAGTRLLWPAGMKAHMKMWDASGRLCYEEESVNGNIMLSSATLPSGIYIIKVRVEGEEEAFFRLAKLLPAR